MKSIEFPESNCALAKDQPEYQTLHVFVENKQCEFVDPPTGKLYNKEVPWSMTACFELSDEEIEEIVRTKKLWFTQMVMGKLFQPVMMSTQNPFITENTTP